MKRAFTPDGTLRVTQVAVTHTAFGNVNSKERTAIYNVSTSEITLSTNNYCALKP
jgi:hypothetical protein